VCWVRNQPGSSAGTSGLSSCFAYPWFGLGYYGGWNGYGGGRCMASVLQGCDVAVFTSLELDKAKSSSNNDAQVRHLNCVLHLESDSSHWNRFVLFVPPSFDSVRLLQRRPTGRRASERNREGIGLADRDVQDRHSFEINPHAPQVFPHLPEERSLCFRWGAVPVAQDAANGVRLCRPIVLLSTFREA